MSEHIFDVMATSERGTPQKIGRTWLTEKGGKVRFSFDLSSMPLSGASVELVSEGGFDARKYPADYALKMPVAKEGKQTYWHPVGQVTASSGRGQGQFDVVFTSIPVGGNLHAFPVED